MRKINPSLALEPSKTGMSLLTEFSSSMYSRLDLSRKKPSVTTNGALNGNGVLRICEAFNPLRQPIVASPDSFLQDKLMANPFDA